MAVTNKELIALAMLENNVTEECATYEQWKFRGYQVQRGCKALFVTEIWKPCNCKNKETNETYRKMLMVKAAFFGLSQVQRIGN